MRVHSALSIPPNFLAAPSFIKPDVPISGILLTQTLSVAGMRNGFEAPIFPSIRALAWFAATPCGPK
jgi:hypothetical protein